MRSSHVIDLADCSEFRQTILSRPPRIVHGWIWILVSIIGAALFWSYLTMADQIVKAPGCIRSADTPLQLLTDVSGTTLSAGLEGQVIDLFYKSGNRIQKGDVLMIIDTTRVDQEIEKLESSMEAKSKNLTSLSEHRETQITKSQQTIEKLRFELEYTRETHQNALRQQQIKMELAKTMFEFSRNEESRGRRLIDRGSISVAAYESLRQKLRESKANLAVEEKQMASIELEKGKIAILLRELQVTETRYKQQLEALEIQIATTGAAIELNRFQLNHKKQERSRSEVYSPKAGIVTSVSVQPGEKVEPGKIVATIACENAYKFAAVVSNEDVDELHEGMKARVKLDAFDYKKYGTLMGRIVSIPSGAEPGPSNSYVILIEFESGAFDKFVGDSQVKLDLTGTAEIITGRERLLTLATRGFRDKASIR